MRGVDSRVFWDEDNEKLLFWEDECVGWMDKGFFEFDKLLRGVDMRMW